METKIKELQQQQQEDTDSKIAAVRELIFGENIKQYDTEFADVYAEIKRLKESSQANLSEAITSLENKLADLESLFDSKVSDLTTDMDKRLADLDEEKADRKKLGQALEKIAQMLQA